MSLSFYYVDAEYVSFLQNIEKEKRGFTHVPNVQYVETREQKFVIGIVLDINGFNYYAPVSSYKKQQKDNILITVDTDKHTQIKGSIRFNYMFPIPNECIQELVIADVENLLHRDLLNKEWKFCVNNETRIRNRAKQTYSKVVNKVNADVVKNSCDFKLLELACLQYKMNKKIT